VTAEPTTKQRPAFAAFPRNKQAPLRFGTQANTRSAPQPSCCARGRRIIRPAAGLQLRADRRGQRGSGEHCPAAADAGTDATLAGKSAGRQQQAEERLDDDDTATCPFASGSQSSECTRCKPEAHMPRHEVQPEQEKSARTHAPSTTDSQKPTAMSSFANLRKAIPGLQTKTGEHHNEGSG
jgi:hypothetical protein